MQPITWLWQNRLAFGKLAIFDGDPDKGKSLVTLDLCARFTTGTAWPDGSPNPGPGNVIVLNAEDGAGDTIRPRLEALGADLNRVFILRRADQASGAVIALPRDVAALDHALHQTGAKMLLIDPIAAFFDSSVQMASDSSVRHALAPLIDLAEKHQCTTILVRHLNKSGGHQSLYRGGGSIGLLAACRSGWLIAVVPRQPHQRLLAVIKNNLAAKQPTLKYEMIVRVGELPRIHWLGPCAMSADHVLALTGGRAVLRLAHAMEFLRLVLHEGPRNVHAIWEFAQQEQVSRTTLKRAKKELQIRSRKFYIGNVQHNYWLLPGQELPPDLQAIWNEVDLEPYLAPLRERFPDPTPLDDL